MKKRKKNYYKENGQKPQEYARNYYWNLSQDKRVERKELKKIATKNVSVIFELA